MDSNPAPKDLFLQFGIAPNAGIAPAASKGDVHVFYSSIAHAKN
jgi:hypothetical protein